MLTIMSALMPANGPTPSTRRSGRRRSRHTLIPISAPSTSATSTRRLLLRVLQPLWKDKQATAMRLRGRIENVLAAAGVAGYLSDPGHRRR